MTTAASGAGHFVLCRCCNDTFPRCNVSSLIPSCRSELRSNGCLDKTPPSDAAFSRADEEMRRYEKEILRLELLVASLKHDRAVLQHRVLDQRSMVQPIRRLPVEALLHIFNLACHIPHVVPNFVAIGDPQTVAEFVIGPIFAISSVCHFWREVALSEPRLWSRIVLPFALKDMRYLYSVMRERSGTLPSHFYVTLPVSSREMVHGRVNQAVLQEILWESRDSVASMFIFGAEDPMQNISDWPRERYPGLSDLQEGDTLFPNLKTLGFFFGEDAHYFPLPYPMGGGLYEWIEYSAVTELHVRGESDEFDEMASFANSKHLTQLVVQGFTVNPDMYQAEGFRSVQRLHIVLEELPNHSWNGEDQLDFPALETLLIECVHLDLEEHIPKDRTSWGFTFDQCPQFALPSLKSLTIGTTKESAPHRRIYIRPAGLVSYFEGAKFSSTLTSLSLRNIGLLQYNGQLSSILPLLPSLTHLDLEIFTDTAGDPNSTNGQSEDSEVRPPAHYLAPVHDPVFAFLQALGLPRHEYGSDDDIDEPVVPNLKSLSINLQEDAAILPHLISQLSEVAAFRSQTRKGYARLEVLRVFFPGVPLSRLSEPRVAQQLDGLKQRGTPGGLKVHVDLQDVLPS